MHKKARKKHENKLNQKNDTKTEAEESQSWNKSLRNRTKKSFHSWFHEPKYAQVSGECRNL